MAMSIRRKSRRGDDSERTLQDALQVATNAIAESVLLRRAIDALDSAVAVHDASGELVLRNQRRLALDEDRHVSALVGAVIERLVEQARGGEAAAETLLVHGSPPRTLDIRALPLGEANRPLGTLTLVEDITERRRLEAVRRDFAANVSHELRTPIGALAVLAETLTEESDPETFRRLATHIMSEAERAGELIEDLLDLSRIEEVGVPAPAAVDIGAVVAAATDRVAPLAAQREVAVLAEAASPTPTVRGDERQLVSAVVNLLDNAVKYSEGGSVVRIALEADERWAYVRVRDHGPGIPEKDLERVFERFYRVDLARSRQTGGTGLGLSIVRHVATNHGGAVDVASREGQGSTFTIRLPRSDH